MFFQLGARLKNGLGSRQSRPDRVLHRRIGKTELIARTSRATAMAALLAGWRDIRRAKLWRADSTTLSKEERADLIEDCKYQLSQLVELENVLQRLASPVCELPLQAVQADRSRIKTGIDRFVAEQEGIRDV